MISRRDLLSSALVLTAANALETESVISDDRLPSPLAVVDTNVSLFHWPFRRLPLDETQALADKLHSLGIRNAWAGSFEGILHRDVKGVNIRLAEACAQSTLLVPIGTLNPELPAWEDDLRRCMDEHNMPGVRLHPNYHGYKLTDKRFLRLLQLATEAKRFVQVVAAMEDTRTQHPLLQVPDVDLAPLPNVMQQCDGATVQILNWRPQGVLLRELAGTPGIFLDIARVEATDGVAQLLRSVPSGRVMYGSHSPFLIPQAALIRTWESELSPDELRSLLSANADQLCKIRIP